MGRAIGRVASRVAAVAASIWCVWLITAAAQTPSCGANPVVCENQLTGDSDYDVAGGGAGDPELQGFASDISVNTGQTVQFKINTTSTHYRIDIYRLGFYGGAGARKVATLPEITTPQAQPDCTFEPTSAPQTGLVDCGNWNVSASWSSKGATSGIYVAKLTRLDVAPNTSSHIPFIVRDDARTADIVFQTSDTTWQAYNQYGGGSMYCGGPISNAGTGYSCEGRAARVSYNRPIDTRDHDPQSFLFNAEYPMVRWLEANGYDVKYWSGVDTDRLGANLIGLQRPKAFLSVGHDEYWSAGQRARVEQARNAGVNLAFFSGNEMFWKTRWESSIDGTATPFRTLVSYKETLKNDTNNDPLDPLDTGTAPISTATWRDTRFGAPADGGRPENALTGQIWTVNCCSSQIEIPASMRALRFWRNTRVAELTAGGVALLPNESLGYEWDEDLDNGFRPAGLVRMSSATRAVAERILDFGSRVGQGTAVHSLTTYRHTSGALVFGAGTVQWSWGLDGTHDRGLAADTHTPDHAMQQATMNLLADMDAQPANPQVGADPNRPLVRGVKSTDALGPISTITSPAVGTTVRSGERVVISGTATDQGGGTVAGVEVSVDGGVTWKAAQGTNAWSFDWSPGAVGLMTVRARAIDDSGNIEAGGAAATVTVEPGTCPCTSLWHPATVPPIPDFNDATPLELGVKFTSDIGGFITGLRYYKSAGNSGPHVANLWTSTGTRLATATFASESTSGWQQVLFPSPVAIAANTMYVASYHTTVGHYAATPGYFTSAGTDAPPLHALTSAVAGGNGVFLSTGASGFPNQSFNATNYWVDVVFSPTNNDTTPPLIFDIAERTIDSANVVITWTTNESATSRIEYSTDIDFPAAGTTTASDAAFVTAHRMALGHLTPNTTYFYRVSSADRAGNTATELAPSFTVPGPTLRDTAQADFAAGQPTFTYAAQTDDGELTLSPAEGAEFSGTSLPDGWRAMPWSGGGFARVDNGLLDVDGWRVGTCSADTTGACAETGTYGPGRSLEFVATFSSDGFEHAGFGVTLGSLAEPWAIFSTFTGGGLVARTNTGAVSVDQPLGSSYIGAPHRYRIDWHLDGTVSYFIDGVQVAAHTAVVDGQMRPVAASDFSVGGGTVTVDWMRMTPYAAAGTFLSRVFDASSVVDWHSIQWATEQPAGTSVAISLRTGNTATPDATWTNFAPIPAPGTLTQRSRFIQYRAELASTDPGGSPSLDDIIISTSHAPVAQNDGAVVPVNGSVVFPASGPGSLTANDTDADVNDVLRVVAVTQPAHGVVLLNADGSVTYAPTLNYEGSDTFTYTVGDGLLVGTATVTMGVGVRNQAPNAQPDAFTLLEDSGTSTLTVLANDSDPEDGKNVTVTAVTQPAHGTVSIAPGAASVAYTPQADFFGSDTFTYTISDTVGATATAAVTLTVTSVNDAPRFVKGADQTVLEDAGATTVAGWATAIGAGAANESGQTLNFVVTNTNTALFAAQPAVAADGTLTFTAQANASGSATITLTLHDNGATANGGVDTSAPQTFTITVTPVNDAPTFVKGADQIIAEDSGAQSVAAWATAISAGAPDETAQTLTFKIASNSNAALFAVQPQISSTGTLTYTPAANASGSANVSVTLSDNGGTANGGHDTSPAQTFTITATSVNDAPSFVKGANQTVLEDAGAQSVTGWATAISAGPVNETGQALDFVVTSDNQALFSGPPAVSPTGTLTFTPATTASGSANVTVKLHDAGGTANGGVDTSAAQTFVITVTAVNDAPSFVKGANQSVLEDAGAQTVAGWATAISTGPADESGQIADFIVTSDNTALFSVAPAVSAAGTLTFTPAANASGTANVTVKAHDNGGTANGGVDTSAAQTFVITITAVNDAPSFVKGANQTVLEDGGAQSVTGWATAISAGPANETGQALDFVVTSDNQALFSGQPAVSPTGTLTFTPATTASGSANVTVKLHDGGGTANGGVDTSAAQTFIISVTAVNDAPSFVKGANQSVLEDAGAQTVAGWATAISAGPANESGQLLDFIVTNDNTSLFSAAPAVSATGTLTFTPAANASGTANVTVKAHDNGGTANGGVDTSAAQTFVITVTGVNDVPSFVKGANQTVLEDAGPQTVAAWATAISAGPASEAGQTVTFIVSSNNAALFAAQPAIAANGTLTYTTAPDANGSATVTVSVRDNGGTANGGVDTSAPQTFTIAVTPVNDPPIAQADTFMATMNQPATIAAPGVLGNDRDIDNAAGTLTAVLGTSPAHGTVTLAANGGFTYVPQADFVGPDSFTYTAVDPLGVASLSATVTIDVQFEAVSGTTTAGGTLSTGATVSVADPIETAVTTPSPSNVTISEGLLSSATPPTGFAFVSRQVNVTVTNPDGTEFVAPLTNPLTLAFTIDASLVPAGQTAATLQVFRNDASVIDCLGATTIPSGSDPCVTKRELGADGSIRLTVLTTHASRWTVGIKTSTAAPIARDDAGYFTNFGRNLAVPGPGVLANDLGRAGMNALIKGVPVGGTVTLSAAGGFTFTPSAGFCGAGSFTYAAKDSSNLESNIATVTILVNCVPTAAADSVSVAEDSPATPVSVLANDSDREDGTNVKLMSVAQAAHGTVVIAAGGTTVTYAPERDYFGSDTFTYTISDTRGDTAVGTVSVTVLPVDDVPSFTKGVDQTVLEDAAARVVTGWATAISAGPANESGQALNFIVTASNTALFSVQPQVDKAGTLTFTPAAGANGSSTVTVSLHDDAGIVDGGVDTSAAQTFAITITAVNDAPSFVKGADQISSAGAGAQSVAGWATSISAGPADESGQALNFIVTTNNAALFSVAPAIAANGTLTYTPAATGGGSAVVTVQLHDNGGTATGGVDTSAAQTFTISLPFATTTTLSSPTVSPTTYGQAVVLNASVTNAGGGGTPQGSIDFLDNSVLLQTVTLVNGSASLTTSNIGAGTARTITAVYKPTLAFVTSQATITRAVNVAATTSTFTVTPSVVQYSDVTTFDTTLTPGNLGSTLPAQTASFKIGTQVVATAPFVWDATAGVLRARYTGPLLEGPTQTGQLKPGSKTVAILYNGVSSNYTVANRTGTMSITREDATVAYIGDTRVVCSANCGAVPVLLKARVTDAQDGSLGDIRNATVAFVNRTTGLTIATVPVAADGTASTTWTVNLGTATSQTTKIGMVVGNYYIRSNTLDDGTVVITK